MERSYVSQTPLGADPSSANFRGLRPSAEVLLVPEEAVVAAVAFR